MRVQPYNYPMEDSLIEKIDLMIKRCTQKNPKRDSVLLIEGEESQGKTTCSIALGYYVSQQTGRPFSDKNVFFDLNNLIDFLQNNEKQIAVWDEPAFQALSKDSLSKIVKNLTRLLMTARKKRHFIMINMAYFNQFNDYLVWQRPLGMIHVYSRKETEPGRFVYIPKRKLEYLWQDWRTRKQRNYKKNYSKRVRGTFPDVINPDYKNNVLSHFNLQEYERRKDEAIAKIGYVEDEEDKTKKYKKEVVHLILLLMKETGKKRDELIKEVNIGETTYYKWKKWYDEEGLEKKGA